MSLKLAIRDYIPFEWEVALKRKKKLNLFIEFVYLSLPDYMKGKNGFKDGVLRIKYIFKHYQLKDCFLLEKVCILKDLDISEYRKIWDEINNDIEIIKFNSL